MGWVPVVLGGIAAALAYGPHGSRLVFWLAVIGAVGCFWSWGVMHNYATNAAKHRRDYRGEFADFRPDEIDAVPNGLAVVNMVFTVITVGALVASIVVRSTS